MTTKRLSDVEPGDLIECLGHWHRIIRREPYNGPLTEVSHILRAVDGWGISVTVPDFTSVEVQ